MKRPAPDSMLWRFSAAAAEPETRIRELRPCVDERLQMTLPILEILNLVEEEESGATLGIAGGTLDPLNERLQRLSMKQRMVDREVADLRGCVPARDELLDHVLDEDRLPHPPSPRSTTARLTPTSERRPKTSGR